MTENCRLEGVEVRQNCQESRLGEMCVDMEAASSSPAGAVPPGKVALRETIH